MKKLSVIGVSGSPFSGGNTVQLLDVALKATEASGCQTELISLQNKNIADCKHCNWCMRKQTKEQVCSIKDDGEAILQKIVLADIIFLASPVYYGRMTGIMANLIDRSRAFVFGSYFEGVMRNKIGGAIAVGWVRNLGIETALLTLHQSLLMLEMIPVSHHHSGVGFGVAGVSTPGGNGKADRSTKLSVLNDTYALKGARAMAKRAVELTRIIKAGSKAI